MSNPAPFIVMEPVSLAQMQALAARLALLLRAGDVVTLSGETGAGKTAFARALIQAIAPHATEVTSPTFTLMQSYEVRLANGASETLWHLDLYRLEKASEAQELGLRELWDHIVLIEWPQIIEDALPPDRLGIAVDFTAAQDTRALRFYGNENWQNRLKHV